MYESADYHISCFLLKKINSINSKNEKINILIWVGTNIPIYNIKSKKYAECSINIDNRKLNISFQEPADSEKAVEFRVNEGTPISTNFEASLNVSFLYEQIQNI